MNKKQSSLLRYIKDSPLDRSVHVVKSLKIREILGVLLRYSKYSLEVLCDSKTNDSFEQLLAFPQCKILLQKTKKRTSTTFIVEIILNENELYGFTYSFINRFDGLGFQITNSFANSDEMERYINTNLQKKVPLIMVNKLEQQRYIKRAKELSDKNTKSLLI